MAENQENTGDTGKGFKNVLFAGIGAIAIGAEQGKDLVDKLAAKGEVTFDQGKQLGKELQAKAGESTKAAFDAALETRMKTMTPEEREAFVAKVAELAETLNAQDAAEAVEAEVVEAEVEVITKEPAAEVVEEVAAEPVAEAPVEAASEVVEA